MVGASERLQYWRSALGITNWRVEWVMLEDPPAGAVLVEAGLAEFYPDDRLVVIRCADDAPNWVLVHELLHVLLYPLTRQLPDGAGTREAEHGIIHTLQQALMNEVPQP